jgi:integrase
MFRIQAHAEKGRQYRILPMAPEFANHLATVPPENRHGPVFRFRPLRKNDRPRLLWISRIFSAIGQRARVKVADRRRRPDARERPERADGHAEPGAPAGPGSPAVKYASAHDLRRAFGVRWAGRVFAPELKELMRHSSITTTMEFYVGQNAARTAKMIWHAFAKANGSSGNPAAGGGGAARHDSTNTSTNTMKSRAIARRKKPQNPR